MHTKTVSRALKRDGAPNKMRKKRGSKLDPHKATVDCLLSEGVWNAVVILHEIIPQVGDTFTVLENGWTWMNIVRGTKCWEQISTVAHRPIKLGFHLA